MWRDELNSSTPKCTLCGGLSLRTSVVAFGTYVRRILTGRRRFVPLICRKKTESHLKEKEKDYETLRTNVRTA